MHRTGASPSPAVALEPDLTIAQAAERKQVSVKTVRRAISSGEIQAYRIGRLIRIPATSLEAWGRPLHYTGCGA
jgi:excisionase family DNA binding protein